MKSSIDKDYMQFKKLQRLGGLGEHGNEERTKPEYLKSYQSSLRSKAKKIGVADIKYQNDKLVEPSKDGSIQLLSNVVATYDSRFINGIDFVYNNVETWTVSGDPPTSLTLESTFTVPGGYNAVVKGYRYYFVTNVPIDQDKLVLTVTTDSYNVFTMTSLKHGTVMPSVLPCFFLSGAGNNIVFKFTASNGIATTAAQAAITPRKIGVEIFGNLLIDTGAPLEMEISNFEQQQRSIAQRLLIKV